METPPHPMRLGNDEKDYYRLGAAGVVAGPRAPGMAGPGGTGRPGGVRRRRGRGHGTRRDRGPRRATAWRRSSEPRPRGRRARRYQHRLHRGRDDLLDPGRRLGRRRAGHDPGPAGGALRPDARGGDALAGDHVRHAGRAVPRLRADHRLHRRGPHAVPVRPDADRHQLGGLDRGDDQGPAAGRRARRRSACSWSCSSASGTRPSARPRRPPRPTATTTSPAWPP